MRPWLGVSMTMTPFPGSSLASSLHLSMLRGLVPQAGPGSSASICDRRWHFILLVPEV